MRSRAKSGKLGGPVAAEKLGLFEDGLGGLFLLVGWIAVLAEDALDHSAELGLDALLRGHYRRTDRFFFQPAALRESPKLRLSTYGTILGGSVYAMAFWKQMGDTAK